MAPTIPTNLAGGERPHRARAGRRKDHRTVASAGPLTRRHNLVPDLRLRHGTEVLDLDAQLVHRPWCSSFFTWKAATATSCRVLMASRTSQGGCRPWSVMVSPRTVAG